MALDSFLRCLCFLGDALISKAEDRKSVINVYSFCPRNRLTGF